MNIVPQFIENTPVSISIYSVTQEAPHYHENVLEIIYCFKGKSTLLVSHEEIELTDGDIISCDPYDIHYLKSSEENLFISFSFDLTHPIFKNRDLKDLLFVCERYVLRKEKQEEMQNLKHYLLTLLYFYCFPHEKVSQTETFNNLATKIIDIMLNHFHLYDYTTNLLEYPNENKTRFEKMLVYTNRHYSEKLTIYKLSEMLHLNANYLSHFFKSTTYFGFSYFLNYIRIYHSEVLLLDTDKNISDISYEMGYSDPKFYYRNFKKWYRHTPLQHRKLLRKVAAEAKDNVIYAPDKISVTLEHYISYYFATLHIPEFWNVPYIPFRNVPIE